MEATKYPMDFDAINKGDIIPAELIEHLTASQRGTDGFRLGALSLRDKIVQHWKANGVILTIALRNDGLHVLSDSAALNYNVYRDKQHRRGIVRTYVRTAGIDRARLTEEERERHDAAMLRQSRVVSAFRRISRMTIKALSDAANAGKVTRRITSQEDASERVS